MSNSSFRSNGSRINNADDSYKKRPLQSTPFRRIVRKSVRPSTNLSLPVEKVDSNINHQSVVTSKHTRSAKGQVSKSYVEDKPNNQHLKSKNFQYRSFQQFYLPIPRQKFSKKLKHKNPKTVSLFALVTIIALVGIYSGINTLITQNRLKVKSAIVAKNIDGDGGASAISNHYENTIITQKDKADYTTQPDLPKLLTIKKINLTARMKRMDISQSGGVMVPKNINDVGWYANSSNPGAPGTVLINGHVDYAGEPGALYNVKKIENGDDIILETGSGRQIYYKVIKKEEIPTEEFNFDKIFATSPKNTQNIGIVANSGKYDNKKQLFDHKLIIYAQKI